MEISLDDDLFENVTEKSKQKDEEYIPIFEKPWSFLKSEDQSREAKFSKCEFFYLAGRYQECINLLEAVLDEQSKKKKNHSSEIFIRECTETIARSHFKLNNFAQAKKYVVELVLNNVCIAYFQTSKYNKAQYWLLLARIETALNNSKESLIACQKGLLANSLNYELWDLLSCTYQKFHCNERVLKCNIMLERLLATQNTQTHSYYKNYYSQKLSQLKEQQIPEENNNNTSALDLEIPEFVEKVLNNASVDENAPLTSEDGEQDQDPSAL